MLRCFEVVLAPTSLGVVEQSLKIDRNPLSLYIYKLKTEPEQYKKVDEESQNFMFATNSFTRRTPARSAGDCQRRSNTDSVTP